VLAGSLSNAWAVTVDGAAAAFVHGGVRYEPSLDLRLMADYTRYAQGTVAPIITPAGAQSRLSLFGFWRPLRRSGFFYFDASLDRLASATGTTTNARLESSSEGEAIRLLPFVRLERDALVGTPAVTHSFTGFTAFVLPHAALGPVLGPLWLHGGIEVELDGAPGPSTYSLSVAWVRGGPGPVLTLAFTSYQSAVRSYTTFTAPTGGTASGTEYLQGSLLWDRASGRLAAVPGPALERSGVSGRVFLDQNGNGIWDPGEPGVPGVRVRVGPSTAVSDSSGAFRVWDIVPFEPVTVEVDSLSLPSPLIVPLFGTALLEPGPNRFRGLDIPLVQAGVIEGSVVRDVAGRREGVAGATLVLVNRRTGARRMLATFSDGGFYALGIVPGDYELTVDRRVLDALHATADPLRFTVASGPTGVGAAGLELRLTPKP
jgi:hypothetical protein